MYGLVYVCVYVWQFARNPLSAVLRLDLLVITSIKAFRLGPGTGCHLALPRQGTGMARPSEDATVLSSDESGARVAHGFGSFPCCDNELQRPDRGWSGSLNPSVHVAFSWSLPSELLRQEVSKGPCHVLELFDFFYFNFRSLFFLPPPSFLIFFFFPSVGGFFLLLFVL